MTSNPSPVYNGRYELRSQVARGGTAQVYLAHDLLLDRPVALKVLFPELSADHAFVERFRREAQAAANLSHPNIVPVFDWGESDRTHFIVMEYVDGEPLSAIVRAEAPLSPPRAASIAADIAKALSYAHRHGVVHRDVKPGNVLITSDGLVKVTDFGIARAMGVDEQVTQTGLVMGTATYFSPEQAQGLGVDGRSDVYALGVVLYEMLTGRPPFTGESPVAIAYQHVSEAAPAPRSLNPAIPPGLEAVVLQAMAKSPAERYASADDLRGDLERFMRGQRVLARAGAASVGSSGGGSGPTTTVMAASPGSAADPLDTSVVEAVPPAERPTRARSTTPWWATAGLLLLVAIGLVVYFGGRSLGYFGGARYVVVPDVRGLKLATAEHQLSAKGLQAKVLSHVKGNQSEAGRVQDQSVSYPNTVRAGRTVGLDVWRYVPPPIVTVPNVSGIGLTYASARSTLRSAGFKVTRSNVKATSPSQHQGEVVGQHPKADARARRKTTVTVNVVEGKAFVTIPTSIEGQSVKAATAALKGLGLKVSSSTPTRLSVHYAAGSVITSKPAPGQAVNPSKTVVLIVSSGGVPVPSVVGDSESYAEQQLAAAGFSNIAIHNSTNSQYSPGSVARTFPKAGTPVQKSRTIVLFVVGATSGAPTGPSGAQGTSGTSGAPTGPSGAPTGPSGAQGTSGTFGTSGTPGGTGPTGSPPPGG